MNKLIVILGPTASGKTSFATHLAYQLDTEIISADSRQVYKQMDIGTGKDLSEYQINGISVPYHLIDILPAGEKYNLFEFKQDFSRVYQGISQKGKIPILCGGTGLYIEAVLKNYNLLQVPENVMLRKKMEGKTLEELTLILSAYGQLHNKTDVDTVKRALRAIEIADYQSKYNLQPPPTSPSVSSIIFGLKISREERRARISLRLEERLKQGMVEEIRGILASGVPPENLIYYGLEYKYVTNYILGNTTYEQMFSELEIAIHQFAKRQMTWFRGMEKRGFEIYWIDALLPMEEKIKLATNKLKESFLT